MTKAKLAKEWVEKEYDELRYEKCERKDFVFTFYELKEMGKQAFLAGLKARNEDTEICEKTLKDKVVDLEKENAELKDDNKVMADNYSKMEQKFYDNLTKAKELLKKWVELFKPKGSNIPSTPIQIATEQFLSEVEK